MFRKHLYSPPPRCPRISQARRHGYVRDLKLRLFIRVKNVNPPIMLLLERFFRVFLITSRRDWSLLWVQKNVYRIANSKGWKILFFRSLIFARMNEKDGQQEGVKKSHLPLWKIAISIVADREKTGILLFEAEQNFSCSKCSWRNTEYIIFLYEIQFGNREWGKKRSLNFIRSFSSRKDISFIFCSFVHPFRWPFFKRQMAHFMRH